MNFYFATAFEYVAPSLQNCLQRRTQLHRLTCTSGFTTRAKDIVEIAAMQVQAHPEGSAILQCQLGLEPAANGQFLARFIQEGLSCVVTHGDDILAILLAETSATKLLKPSAVLIAGSLTADEIDSLRDVATQMYGHLASLASLSIQCDDWSYEVVLF